VSPTGAAKHAARRSGDARARTEVPGPRDHTAASRRASARRGSAVGPAGITTPPRTGARRAGRRAVRGGARGDGADECRGARQERRARGDGRTGAVRHPRAPARLIGTGSGPTRARSIADEEVAAESHLGSQSQITSTSPLSRIRTSAVISGRRDARAAATIIRSNGSASELSSAKSIACARS
jgi:hypothetical protein